MEYVAASYLAGVTNYQDKVLTLFPGLDVNWLDEDEALIVEEVVGQMQPRMKVVVDAATQLPPMIIMAKFDALAKETPTLANG